MPPDEYVHKCDNSAYTNAAASLALAAPAKFSRLFDPSGASITATQQMWEELSTKIVMPFDTENEVMLEHDSFPPGEKSVYAFGRTFWVSTSPDFRVMIKSNSLILNKLPTKWIH